MSSQKWTSCHGLYDLTSAWSSSNTLEVSLPFDACVLDMCCLLGFWTVWGLLASPTWGMEMNNTIIKFQFRTVAGSPTIHSNRGCVYAIWMFTDLLTSNLQSACNSYDSIGAIRRYVQNETWLFNKLHANQQQLFRSVANVCWCLTKCACQHLPCCMLLESPSQTHMRICPICAGLCF